MAVQTKKGTITCPASTGNQSTSGLGFTPQAVIFFSSGETASSPGDGWSTVFGVMTSGGLFSAYRRIRDNALSEGGTGRTGGNQSGLFTAFDPAAAASPPIFSNVSLNADGFTVNFTQVNSGVVIHYFAIGGVTSVKVGGNASIGSGSTAVTGVGFQPDALLMFGDHFFFGSNFEESHSFSVGAAISSSSRACVSIGDSNDVSQRTQVNQQQITTKMLQFIGADGAKGSMDLVSMDSDGFTYTGVTGGTYCYLAIKGGQPKVGVDTQKTSTGTKATTGLATQRAGVLLLSCNAVASSSISTTQEKVSVGASDATSHGAIWGQSEDNNGTLNTNGYSTTSVAVSHRTQPSTTDAEAAVSSLDADGFTLNWTTADATARQFVHFSIGGPPPDPVAKRFGTNRSGLAGVAISSAGSRAANW